MAKQFLVRTQEGKDRLYILDDLGFLTDEEGYRTAGFTLDSVRDFFKGLRAEILMED